MMGFVKDKIERDRWWYLLLLL